MIDCQRSESKKEGEDLQYRSILADTMSCVAAHRRAQQAVNLFLDFQDAAAAVGDHAVQHAPAEGTDAPPISDQQTPGASGQEHSAGAPSLQEATVGQADHMFSLTPEEVLAVSDNGWQMAEAAGTRGTGALEVRVSLQTALCVFCELYLCAFDIDAASALCSCMLAALFINRSTAFRVLSWGDVSPSAASAGATPAPVTKAISMSAAMPHLQSMPSHHSGQSAWLRCASSI